MFPLAEIPARTRKSCAWITCNCYMLDFNSSSSDAGRAACYMRVFPCWRRLEVMEIAPDGNALFFDRVEDAVRAILRALKSFKRPRNEEEYALCFPSMVDMVYRNNLLRAQAAIECREFLPPDPDVQLLLDASAVLGYSSFSPFLFDRQREFYHLIERMLIAAEVGASARSFAEEISKALVETRKEIVFGQLPISREVDQIYAEVIERSRLLLAEH